MLCTTARLRLKLRVEKLAGSRLSTAAGSLIHLSLHKSKQVRLREEEMMCHRQEIRFKTINAAKFIYS